MDILHRRGRATVAEVMSELSGEPAYSTVRAQLRVLEEKGHVRHEENNCATCISRRNPTASPADPP
jgi:predicted transcriptional regulator